jgi:hypothetical protein
MTNSLKAMLDRLEQAAMAYERLGKITRDDAKTRALRKAAITELARARLAFYAYKTPGGLNEPQ